VAIQRRHVVHGAVAVVVLVFLGLAAAFLIDSIGTNSNYDALAAHQVKLRERSRVCVDFVCRISDVYRGTRFTAELPLGENTTMLVDPRDRSIRMSEYAFSGGPGSTSVDDVFAGLFAFGALVMATAHIARVRRRRRRTGEDGPRRWGVPLAPEDDPDVTPFSGPEPP